MALLLTVLFVAGATAKAETARLTPAADGYTSEGFPDRNYGKSDVLAVKETLPAGPPPYRYRMYSLLKFDMPSLDASEARVTRAFFQFKCIWAGPADTKGVMRLDFHRVLKPWEEGKGKGDINNGVTWEDRNRGAETWSSKVNPPVKADPSAKPEELIDHEMLEKTDYEAEPFYSIQLTESASGTLVSCEWKDPATVAVVADWIKNPEKNHGFVIIPHRVEGDLRQLNFVSRETKAEQDRPALIIDYKTQSEPAAARPVRETLGLRRKTTYTSGRAFPGTRRTTAESTAAHTSGV